MPIPRTEFRAEIISLVKDNEGIAMKDVRKLLGCGNRQLRQMINRMVKDEEIHRQTRINKYHLYTFDYAKENDIPEILGSGKSKAVEPDKGSATGRANQAARTGQRLLYSLMRTRSGA